MSRAARQILTILLVEDNPGDTLLVREMLSEESEFPIDVIAVGTLSAALKQLRGVSNPGDGLPLPDETSGEVRPIDVILLDLNLPDSQGFETFLEVHRKAPAMPILVLTGGDDKQLSVQAVRAGAQDYLVKGRMDGPLLIRSIRHAMERNLLLLELENRRQESRREEEIRLLERLGGGGQPPITARLLGVGPLKESIPDAFDGFVSAYEDLVDQSLEERTRKVDYDISERLREMADQMGFLKAGPRDVVDVHTEVLQRKMKGKNPKKTKAYLEEGRIILLELMGYLAAHYRNHAVVSL